MYDLVSEEMINTKDVHIIDLVWIDAKGNSVEWGVILNARLTLPSLEPI